MAARSQGCSSHVRCVFRRNLGSLTLDVTPSPTTAWRAVSRVLRSPLDVVSCVLLPASCHLCGSPLPQLSPVPVCDVCWAEMPASDARVCVRCGDAVWHESAENSVQCRACRLAPPPFVGAVSAGLYGRELKAAVHALKYEGFRAIADGLGELLASAVAQIAPPVGPAQLLVVPVPLHRARQQQRGFNQADLLADQAVAALRTSHPEWQLRLQANTLQRMRATSTQAGLTPRQRRINLRAAFRVAGAAAIEGKSILLVDDIMTTGATARAASKALIDAGAKEVWVATLARARRNSVRDGARFAAGSISAAQPTENDFELGDEAEFYHPNASRTQPSQH